MTEKQINEKLIIVLEEKIQLLEEQKVISQKIIDIQNEQLILSGVVKSLPTEKELGEEIKNKLAEINKDKPVPSTKHDLGYSNGFIDCYYFMAK
jgi:hypothetical protein